MAPLKIYIINGNAMLGNKFNEFKVQNVGRGERKDVLVKGFISERDDS